MLEELEYTDKIEDLSILDIEGITKLNESARESSQTESASITFGNEDSKIELGGNESVSIIEEEDGSSIVRINQQTIYEDMLEHSTGVLLGISLTFVAGLFLLKQLGIVRGVSNWVKGLQQQNEGIASLNSQIRDVKEKMSLVDRSMSRMVRVLDNQNSSLTSLSGVSSQSRENEKLIHQLEDKVTDY